MTTQPQPEALRLADALNNGYTFESQPMVVYGWADDCPAWDAAAELLRLHAECEALWAAFNAACAFIDCHVGDWDLTKEMVSKHAAFVKARAELAARAAKEQSNG